MACQGQTNKQQKTVDCVSAVFSWTTRRHKTDLNAKRWWATQGARPLNTRLLLPWEEEAVRLCRTDGNGCAEGAGRLTNRNLSVAKRSVRVESRHWRGKDIQISTQKTKKFAGNNVLPAIIRKRNENVEDNPLTITIFIISDIKKKSMLLLKNVLRFVHFSRNSPKRRLLLNPRSSASSARDHA